MPLPNTISLFFMPFFTLIGIINAKKSMIIVAMILSIIRFLGFAVTFGVVLLAITQGFFTICCQCVFAVVTGDAFFVVGVLAVFRA